MDFPHRGTVAYIQTDPCDPACRPAAVFVTEPFKDEANNGMLSVVIVPITLAINPPLLGDTTCLLELGAHEFIKELSWVSYKEAYIMDCATVKAYIKDRLIVLSNEPMQEEPLCALFAGITKSPYTPKNVLLFYRAATA